MYTLRDGQAALALESIFRKLDQRFRDKVAADRVGETVKETFGLKIMKHETTGNFH